MWTVYHYNGNSTVTNEDAKVEYFVRVYFLSLLVGLRLTDIRLSLC